MKKIFIEGPRRVVIRDEAIPTPGPQQLLVKTELSGVSAGTEMMLYRGTYPNFRLKKWAQWTDYPVCPGYELVGTVVAVGDCGAPENENAERIASLQPKSPIVMTDASEFKVGDRVVCLGEHGEYALVPANLAVKVPDHVPSEEATLAVLATTAMHAIRQAEIRYGDTVAVIGCGILGYLVMQHALNSGARRVIVMDVDDDRLRIAKETGADACINPRKVDAEPGCYQGLIQAVKDANDGLLADVVIEASGFKGTEQQALEIVRQRGRVVIVGWHTQDIEFMFGDYLFKEVTMVASSAIGPEAGLPYAYVRWCSDQSLKWSMELISKGKLSGKHFKPTRFHYTDIEKVYDMIDRRDPAVGLQTMLYWNEK